MFENPRLGPTRYGPPALGRLKFCEKARIWVHPDFETPDVGHVRLRFGHRRPKYVAAVNLGMWQPESLVWTSLSMYSPRADRQGAGNLDGNSGPPGLNFHPDFRVFF